MIVIHYAYFIFLPAKALHDVKRRSVHGVMTWQQIVGEVHGGGMLGQRRDEVVYRQVVGSHLQRHVVRPEHDGNLQILQESPSCRQKSKPCLLYGCSAVCRFRILNVCVKYEM